MLVVVLDDESSSVCKPCVPVSDVLELSTAKEGLALNFVLIPFDVKTAVGKALVNVGRISAVIGNFLENSTVNVINLLSADCDMLDISS